MNSRVSIGVAGALGPGAIAHLAAAAEEAGFHALWVNDTPHGDSLAALAAAAAATDTLTLATGVIPVDRRSAQDILAAADGLPAERLVLGIGSGTARQGALARVRDAAAELKAGTAASIVIGALGPRMRQTAAEVSDGALLSWLTPDVAAAQAGEQHAAGARAVLYVRTALDAAAVPALEKETARYAGFPNYAAHFSRLGIDPAETVLRPDTAAGRLPAYRDAVDEVVLRAITPGDDLAAYVAFIEGARALVTS